MNAPVVPSRTLLQGFEYVPAVRTNLAATFARVRAEQEAAKRAQPSNLKQLKRKAP